jgi:DNA repair exonuclease SbcCD ATPase subunit
MSATDAFSEPSLFDLTASEPASKAPATPRVEERSARAAIATAPLEPIVTSGSSEAASDRPDSAALVSDAADTVLSPEATTQSDRKRLAEQLSALKRKEAELRRALAAADHPELSDAIRLIEARAFVVARAEAKLAQGFSKTEARRREVIEKKLGSLRDKRAALDTQIGSLETELGGLGSDRLASFGQERQEALQQLLIALGTHETALHDAGLDPASLVPEIEGWLPELEALASKVSGASA